MNESIQLDWEAYYTRFKQMHGDPVRVGERLLFSDGWGYGLAYEGPEYPPPNDPNELRRLRLLYWRSRRAVVRAERDSLATEIEGLQALQSERSAQLYYRVEEQRVTDDGVEYMAERPEPLDVGAVRSGRLAWLDADLWEAQAMIDELTNDTEREKAEVT